MMRFLDWTEPSRPAISEGMGFRARIAGLVGVGSLGLSVLGCGQVVGAKEEGAGGPGNAEPAGLPAVSDRYAFAKSGERIQALGYVSEGVAQFRTLHDELLGFDCEFIGGLAGDDLHCFPKVAGRLVYLDAGCSQLATWDVSPRANAGAWLRVGSGSLPPFELGEQLFPEGNPGGVPPIYDLVSGACVAIRDPPAKEIPAVYQLIAHDVDELVAARSVSMDAGGGLRLTRAMGEDGSELTLAVTNTAGEECRIDSDGACVPIKGNETGPFPSTQRVRQGSGSVHLDLFTSAPAAGSVGVPVGRYPEVFDFLDDAGNRCSVKAAVDGTLRCATLEPKAYESGYADAACTQRLYYGQPVGVDTSTLHAALFTDKNELIATSSVRVHEGPVYDGGVGHCAPYTSAPANDLLELDQRVDVSTMPEVVETTL